jgi:hypothetical protein
MIHRGNVVVDVFDAPVAAVGAADAPVVAVPEDHAAPDAPAAAENDVGSKCPPRGSGEIPAISFCPTTLRSSHRRSAVRSPPQPTGNMVGRPHCTRTAMASLGMRMMMSRRRRVLTEGLIGCQDIAGPSTCAGSADARPGGCGPRRRSWSFPFRRAGRDVSFVFARPQWSRCDWRRGDEVTTVWPVRTVQ